MNHDLSSRALRTRQSELLDQLDDLETAIAELTALTTEVDGDDEDDERRERIAWLYRQQSGVLILLTETERALLVSGEPEPSVDR